MKVVILAGGYGTRLAEETHLKPKPMVDIGGYPILWHIMETYAHYGHKDFYIALGYKAEVIKEFFLGFHARNADFTVDLSSGSVESFNRKDKDWRNMIKVITKYTKHIYAVDLADEDMVPANDIIKAIKLDELSIIKSSALAEFLNDITEKTLIFGSFKIVNLARQISQNQLSWDSPNQLGEDDA